MQSYHVIIKLNLAVNVDAESAKDAETAAVETIDLDDYVISTEPDMLIVKNIIKVAEENKSRPEILNDWKDDVHRQH